MQARMNPLSRMISLGAAIVLVGVIFLPLWKIKMTAPQYPEGLILKIYSNKLGGDVEVVNGLNHYIGMRTLHEKDFPEFIVLPYIIGTLVFFGLLTVIINRRWFFLAWSAFYMIFSVTAMIDFYRWEYNYGHNLDPTAPIQVPGMSYQPPLIGFKQLLNFGVYSIPDVGGIIFIGVALLLLFSVYIEWRTSRKIATIPLSVAVPFVLFVSAFFVSCSSGPRAIEFGKDTCAFCKMTLSDIHFGGEVLTRKGKVILFDDVACLREYLRSGILPKEQVKDIYLVDYSMKGTLVHVKECFLIQGEEVRSPMGGNIAVFAMEDSMKKYSGLLKASAIPWTDPYKKDQ